LINLCFPSISVENGPIVDERLQILIDDELKTFGIKEGDSIQNN
jgi:hypothetical protein